MNRRRRSTGAFLALSAFLALPLASRAAHAAQPAKLVIAYAAVTARIMPLLIAQDQGYFAKYGIDSQPVLIRGGTPLVVGLAAGDIQIGRTAGAAVLSAVASGHDLKMVATFTSRNSYNVVVKSTIKRPEDIRGKRIAINSYGGGTWVGTMLWLEHFGLDPQRDNILLQSFGDQSMQAQALDTGADDFLSKPFSYVVLVARLRALVRRGSAARATGSPPRRPTRSGVPRHAWATRVAGCSATAPSPTWRFNRNSGTRDSTAGSLVRPGLGGVAAWPSAGSDRYSGPTPTTTCSITFTGPMPMTTFGRMPTMMSTMASTVLTPIAALTVTAPMPIRTDTMPAGARAAA